MRLKILTGLVLVIMGLIISLYALYDLVYHRANVENIALLILGCILMVTGAFFKYSEELEELEEKTEKKGEGRKKISSWRLKDLEYRLRKIEKGKEGSEEEGESEEINKKESVSI
jgi:hypothetical protein